MSELAFCKTFLTALDARPAKLSSDHIADARQFDPGVSVRLYIPYTSPLLLSPPHNETSTSSPYHIILIIYSQFTLPRLPHPPHPTRPSPKTSQPTTSSSLLTLSLKPLKPSFPTIPLSKIDPSKISIYDLKAHYASESGIPAAKIKILYKKKPVTDSKTVAEVVAQDAGGEVEFGVMLMAGAAASTPVTSPPAVAPSEGEKGLAGASADGGPAAQGPSGKEVVATEEFWADLKNFVMQRTKDEAEAERLAKVFRGAWESNK